MYRTLSTSAASFAAALSLGVTTPAQTTYYVDVSATGPGLGTQEEPWTSVQTAIDVPSLTAADTIRVAPGTYYEELDSGGKGFRLESSGGPLVTEIRATGPGSPIFVWGNGTVHLSGFTLANGGKAFAGASVTGFLSISDCVVRDNKGRGIRTNSVVVIERCTITQNETGLASWNGSNYTVRDSVIWDNLTYDVAVIGGGHFGQYDIRHSLYSASKSTVVPAGGVLMNNLHEDPLFWEPGADDFGLQPGSVCIGAGVTGGDIGALPFDTSHAPVAPTVYCSSKVNSLGCTPSIGASGTPSMSGGAFDITCSNVINNKLGLLFYGYQSKHAAYQGGWLCVRNPVHRTQSQNAGGNPPPDDCSGLYTLDFAALIQSGVDPALAVGGAAFAQFWYRDPNAAVGTTGRSDALSFTIQP